jgi:hypothetical protein
LIRCPEWSPKGLGFRQGWDPNADGTYEVLDDALTLLGTGGDARSRDTWAIVKPATTELALKTAFGTVECVKK